MKRFFSRRDFLGKGSAFAGSVALVLPSACSKKPNCSDLSGLTEAEKATRKALKYVEQSNDAKKNCANCSLYKPPAAEGQCGTCTLLKGPVVPAGNCTGWQAKS